MCVRACAFETAPSRARVCTQAWSGDDVGALEIEDERSIKKEVARIREEFFPSPVPNGRGIDDCSSQESGDDSAESAAASEQATNEQERPYISTQT